MILTSSQIIGGCTIDISNTPIYDCSIFSLPTGIPMKLGRVKLVHTFPHCEIIRPCECFPYARKRPTHTCYRANNKHKL